MNIRIKKIRRDGIVQTYRKKVRNRLQVRRSAQETENVKAYGQKTNFTCGPASLKMVMDYHGVNKSERTLAKAAGTSRKQGTDHDGMIKAAKKFGFKAKRYENQNLSDIKEQLDKGNPVIVDWFPEGGGHFSVVSDIEENKVVVKDPAYGKTRKIPKNEFREAWFDYKGFTPKKKNFYTRTMIVLEPENK